MSDVLRRFKNAIRSDKRPMPNEEAATSAATASAATASASAEVVSDLTDQTLADDTAEDVFLGDAEDAGGSSDDDNNAADSPLRAQLAEANRRADEANEAFLRARADFSNYKRRTDEEKAGLRQRYVADILEGLLPIVDNFERAIQAASQNSDHDKLIAGVNAVYRQMQDYLARQGVTPIEALYEPFDPNFHNAVQREETTEHPENTVVEELQKGYVLQGGRVLRPTMVKVATGTE